MNIRLNLLLSTVLMVSLFNPFDTHACNEIQLLRKDGSSIKGYFSHPENISHFPIMIVCQGSYVHGEKLQTSKPLFNKMIASFGSLPIGILALEKRGSLADSLDLKEFNQYNTITNRIDDHNLLIKSLQKLIPEWNGKLILAGGSEGSLVAGYLADQWQTNVTTLLLFVAGGSQPFQEEIIQSFLLQPWYIRWLFGSETYMRNQFDHMKKDPTHLKIWRGQTYQYWRDAADKSLTHILKLKMPVYYMMGTHDDLFESGKKLNEMAIESGNDSITFIWYEELGHDLGDSFKEVMSHTKKWLQSLIL